jgi:hypothetical protein
MPPKAAGKAPAGKAPAKATKSTAAPKKKATSKKVAPAGGRKRKKRRAENWNTYIFRGTFVPRIPDRQMVSVFELLPPPFLQNGRLTGDTSLETSPSQRRNLQQGHVNHELVLLRHL